MTLSLALRTALSGLSATQAALQVTANNITNVNTEGFTRKITSFTSRSLQGLGAGVEVAAITRVVDEFLLGQIREEQSLLGELRVREQFLSEVENFFGTPDNDRAISSAMDDLKNALEGLSVTPEADANKFNAINEARQLTQRFQELSGAVQRLRLKADQEVSRAATTIDNQLTIIKDLNVRIGRAAGLNQPNGDLRDERDRAMEKLTDLIDVRVIEGSNSQVTILTNTGRNLLSGAVKEDVSHISAAQINASISYLAPSDSNYPGSVSGLFLGTPDFTNGTNDITTEIRSGQLKALIELRDTTLPNLQAELDRVAQTMMVEVNKLHNQGTAFPPPATLTGSHNFVSGDPLSATGAVRISVINQTTGAVVENLDIADLSIAGLDTVGEVVTAINAMTNASASLVNGKLVISATNAGQGIAINESTSAYVVAGAETRGLSHYFGLNDLFVADVTTSDYNAYTSGQQANSTSALGLAGTLTFQGAGFTVAAASQITLAYTSGQSLDTIAANITTALSAQSITATVVNDGTGRRLLISDTGKDNFIVTDSGSLLSTINLSDDNTGVSKVLEVRSDIITDPARIARGTLSSSATVGQDGITIGDGTTANSLAGVFESDFAFVSSGGISATTTTINRFAAQILSVHAALTFDAKSELEFNDQFLETLQFRSEGISGVNLDEELSNLVVFEQAFNAAARVVTVTADLLDELLDAVR